MPQVTSDILASLQALLSGKEERAVDAPGGPAFAAFLASAGAAPEEAPDASLKSLHQHNNGDSGEASSQREGPGAAGSATMIAAPEANAQADPPVSDAHASGRHTTAGSPSEPQAADATVRRPVDTASHEVPSNGAPLQPAPDAVGKEAVTSVQRAPAPASSMPPSPSAVEGVAPTLPTSDGQPSAPGHGAPTPTVDEVRPGTGTPHGAAGVQHDAPAERAAPAAGPRPESHTPATASGAQNNTPVQPAPNAETTAALQATPDAATERSAAPAGETLRASQPAATPKAASPADPLRDHTTAPSSPPASSAHRRTEGMEAPAPSPGTTPDLAEMPATDEAEPVTEQTPRVSTKSQDAPLVTDPRTVRDTDTVAESAQPSRVARTTSSADVRRAEPSRPIMFAQHASAPGEQLASEMRTVDTARFGNMPRITFASGGERIATEPVAQHVLAEAARRAVSEFTPLRKARTVARPAFLRTSTASGSPPVSGAAVDAALPDGARPTPALQTTVLDGAPKGTVTGLPPSAAPLADLPADAQPAPAAAQQARTAFARTAPGAADAPGLRDGTAFSASPAAVALGRDDADANPRSRARTAASSDDPTTTDRTSTDANTNRSASTVSAETSTIHAADAGVSASADTPAAPDAVAPPPSATDEATAPTDDTAAVRAAQSSATTGGERAESTAASRRTLSLAWLRNLMSEPIRSAVRHGWKTVELQLEGRGTVTIQARQQDEQLAVAVGFSDPTLRALVNTQAHQLQSALEAQYGTSVDLSLMDGDSGEGTDDQRSQNTSGRAQADLVPESVDDEAPQSERRGARHVWVG